MQAVIVGHGPSLLQKQLGSQIDRFDFVVRQKRCGETLKYPAQFGSKVDAVCGSFTIAMGLPQDVKAPQYWVFMDSRHHAVPAEQVEQLRRAVPCIILRERCDYWNQRYRDMRQAFAMNPAQERKKTSDDLGHTHMSAGLHALIYACELLKPSKIVLAGFDNVQSGGFTWSISRGPDWKQYPDHNWATEHRMVPVIADHYGVEVAFS